MKQRNYISYLIAFSLFFGTSNRCEEPEAGFKNRLFTKVTTLFKSLAVYEAGILAHELGHALAGKLLFNSPIDIRMGGIEPIIKIPGIPISLAGFNPVIAYAVANFPIPPTHSYHDMRTMYLKLITFSAAGPLAGALFYAIALKNTSYTKTALMGISDNLFSLCPIYIEKLNYATDGSLIHACIRELRTLAKH